MICLYKCLECRGDSRDDMLIKCQIRVSDVRPVPSSFTDTSWCMFRHSVEVILEGVTLGMFGCSQVC